MTDLTSARYPRDLRSDPQAIAREVLVPVPAEMGGAAAMVPLGQLAEATSIGTLFAFLLVNIGVMVLRRTRPDLKRSFMAPFFPLTPILGMLFCGYLLVGALAGASLARRLPAIWLRRLVVAVGAALSVIYFIKTYS